MTVEICKLFSRAPQTTFEDCKPSVYRKKNETKQRKNRLIEQELKQRVVERNSAGLLTMVGEGFAPLVSNSLLVVTSRLFSFSKIVTLHLPA